MPRNTTPQRHCELTKWRPGLYITDGGSAIQVMQGTLHDLAVNHALVIIAKAMRPTGPTSSKGSK